MNNCERPKILYGVRGGRWVGRVGRGPAGTNGQNGQNGLVSMLIIGPLMQCMGFAAEAAVGWVGRSVGTVGRTGRSDGRTVGGRPGRVRDLNSLLRGFGLVVGLWTCSGARR